MPPRLRPGTIERARLVRLLMAPQAAPVVSVIAPPGYGKTTLLAQWAERERAAVAWLTVDDLDNDPWRLLYGLATAFNRATPASILGRAALGGTGTRTPADAIVDLMAEVRRRAQRSLLIVDDAHRLTDRTCLDLLDRLLENVPARMRVAIAGRIEPDFSLARIRAAGRLLEINRRLLALDEAETAALTAAAGCELDADEVRALTVRTEGWPAATYLAALSMIRGQCEPGSVKTISGVDPYIAAYFRSEFERGIDDEDVQLLTRTAVLEHISPAVAEAVAGVDEAGKRLRILAHDNLLIQELGPPGRTFRYHNLLRDFLLAELERREPGQRPSLHRKAAGWYAAGGRYERALEHANAGGDVDLAARVVVMASGARQRVGTGTIARWVDRFQPAAFQRFPPLAVVAAWTYLLTGRPDAADRMADIVERATFDEAPLDGSASFESQRAALLAMMARNGPRQMLANAAFAVSHEGPESRWRPFGLAILGAAYLMLGETNTADRAFREAVVIGVTTVPEAAMVSLAARASIRVEMGDWAAADMLIKQAVEIMGDDLDGTLPSLLVHAVDARVAILRGDLQRAHADLSRSASIVPLANHAAPWLSVGSLLDLAQAHLSISDPGGARPILRFVEQIVRRRPNLGAFTTRLIQVRRQVAAASSTLVGSSAFTPAELRVLPYLATYLSFQEIADRLAISRNTVKTHAMSIYGKLWSSSRSEAVRRAVELGLLEPYPVLQPDHPGLLIAERRFPPHDEERWRMEEMLDAAQDLQDVARGLRRQSATAREEARKALARGTRDGRPGRKRAASSDQ